MQILQQQRIRRSSRETRLVDWARMGLMLAFAGIVVIPALAAEGQQGAAQVTPKPIVIPDRTLDSHELKDLAEKSERKKNFEAANEARKRAIDDEVNKLVILARDLKARTENPGGAPLPRMLVREAEVIEILANDVKEKMKLTVNVD